MGDKAIIVTIMTAENKKGSSGREVYSHPATQGARTIETYKAVLKTP